MDVTRENFLKVLPDLEADLEDCEFVAIDFEMSGISLNDRKDMRSTYADIPQERYAKMRPVATRFSIVQMGVAIFSQKSRGGKGKGKGKVKGKGKGKGAEESETMTVKPYNFYTFAEEGEDLVLSLSAIHFLKDQGMDFNHWFRAGVSYTNARGEEYHLGKIEKERERDRQEAEAAAGGGGEKQRMRLTRQGDIEFVKSQLATLKNWYDSDGPSSDHGGSPEEIKEAAHRHKELALSRCNNFLRRALYEAIEFDYPDLITENRNGQILVLRLTPQEKKAREEAREAERQARFTSIVGVRNVFKALGACGKPLIVHNGMYDLMFMMCAFHGPLPPTLVEFKSQLLECFPLGLIFDTKYISSREDLLGVTLNDTGVEGLYATLVTEASEGLPKLELGAGFEKYAGGGGGEGEKSFAHEAGYDAYLTGAIFARMRTKLVEAGNLGKVMNRVYNYRSLFETHLGGEDPLMYQGGHVFHLELDKEKGKGVKTDDLMKIFGVNSIHTSILWVDDTGAFAVVNAAAGAKEQEVLAVLGVTPAGVSMTSFHSWYRKKQEEVARKIKEEEENSTWGGKGNENGGRSAGAGEKTEGALAWIMSFLNWVPGVGGGRKRQRV